MTLGISEKAARTGSRVVQFESTPGQRPAVLAAVEEFCRAAGGDDRSIGHLRLAIDELFTNLVSYGYDDDGPHRLTVEMAVPQPGAVSIRLVDDGRRFNPLERADPTIDLPLEERPIGGLGIHLVKTFMDRCEYAWEDGTNRLTLVKRFEPPEKRQGRGK